MTHDDWRLAPAAAACILSSLITFAGCGGRCAAIPCPSPGFDENTCSCISGGAPSGAAGTGDSSTNSAPQSNGGSLSPCDPLTAATTAVALEPSNIVDAGTDTDGTVYVLVDQNSALRLFVGSTSRLTEVYVMGSGQGSHDPGRFWTVQSTTSDGSLVTVEVQTTSTGRAMGVVKGPISAKGFDVGTVGDVLTPMTAVEAATIPVATTQTFHLEYFGTSASTNVVVIAPDHFDSYDAFRLFLGPSDNLAEQSVTTVSRGLSIPSNTTIDFIDAYSGNPAVLTYGVRPGTLSTGGATTILDSSSPAVLPMNAAFECR